MGGVLPFQRGGDEDWEVQQRQAPRQKQSRRQKQEQWQNHIQYQKQVQHRRGQARAVWKITKDS